MKTHLKSLCILRDPEPKPKRSSAWLCGLEAGFLCIALAVLELRDTQTYTLSHTHIYTSAHAYTH